MSEGRDIKVFTSYSHTPEENAEFVRGLVGRLRSSTHPGVRFDVWLDEERLHGAADVASLIRGAISSADAALFVVNGRWTERERRWIRKEVELLEERSDIPLLVLQREDIPPSQLDHIFAALKRLSWLPDDPMPDARFWEVFCGLIKKEPGPKWDWARKGREITGDEQHPPSRVSPSHEPTGNPRTFPLRGRPIAAFSSGDHNYILTERDEWATWTGTGRVLPRFEPPCEFAAALADDQGGFLIAGYDGTISRFNGRTWKLLNQASPVLCLASSPAGELIGTAGGHILLAGSDSVTTVARMRDPVVALAAIDGAVLAIGARGAFGRIDLAHLPSSLVWIDIGDHTQPFGFFQTVEATSIGLFGSTWLAVLDTGTGQITHRSGPFEDGVRQVSFLGASKWPYALLTDTGNLIRLNGTLGNARQVHFPKGTCITGCLALVGRGTLLAWSDGGTLFRVAPDGSPETIADRDVVLAFTSGLGESAELVRWSEAGGVSLEALVLEP